MKYSSLLLFILFALCDKLHGQPKSKLAGIYSLNGVMEIASVFKLHNDSTFEFYYSYGALDRHGSGKWGLKRDSIVFNSRAYPGRDFKIIDSSKKNNNYITLKIKNENPSFYRLIYCFFRTTKGDTLYNADEDGTIRLPGISDTINLIFELSSERISTFLFNNTKYNYYTLRLEPWAVEIFFKNFSLYYTKDHLEGRHPLLDEKKYIYNKEQ